jgi:hypothetical protein
LPASRRARLGAQAAGDDDLAVLGQRLADGVQAFLDGVVDEAAGVDDHQVGALEGLGGLVALGAQLGEDQLGVGQRLGAAQADEADLGRGGDVSVIAAFSATAARRSRTAGEPSVRRSLLGGKPVMPGNSASALDLLLHLVHQRLDCSA